MKQIHKIKKINVKWPWQIVLMLIPLVFLYPGFGVDGRLKVGLVTGWILYALVELLADSGRFPRNRKNDRKVIPVFLLLGAEFIVDGIYAYVNHLPFFRTSISVILQKAFLAGWSEEIFSTLVWVTVLVNLFYHWKKKITRWHLSIVSFVAGTIFGLSHMGNLLGLGEIYSDKPQFFIMLFYFLPIINAIAGGLIFKSIFLKTGSLFYCILLHFLMDVSRMGTAFPNSSLIYASVLTFIYLIYGAYESICMDETTVNEWNRRLKLSNNNSVES